MEPRGTPGRPGNGMGRRGTEPALEFEGVLGPEVDPEVGSGAGPEASSASPAPQPPRTVYLFGAWCLIPLALGASLHALYEPIAKLSPTPGPGLRWLITAAENPIRSSLGIGLLWTAVSGWPGCPGGRRVGGSSL